MPKNQFPDDYNPFSAYANWARQTLEPNPTPRSIIEVKGNPELSQTQIFINREMLSDRLRELGIQADQVKIILDYRNLEEVSQELLNGLPDATCNIKSFWQFASSLPEEILNIMIRNRLFNLTMSFPNTKRRTIGFAQRERHTITILPRVLEDRLISRKDFDPEIFHQRYVEVLSHELKHLSQSNALNLMGKFTRLACMLGVSTIINYLAQKTEISQEMLSSPDALYLQFFIGAYMGGAAIGYKLDPSEISAYAFDEWAKNDFLWRQTIRVEQKNK